MRDKVGVLDLPGFSRFHLQGAGAAKWLMGLIAGRLPAVGRIALAYFPDTRGRILTEMSVLRHDEDDFTLITAAAAQWHDFELLKRSLPGAGAISLSDHTDDYSTLIVTGPESWALFAKISNGDLERPWLTHQSAEVAGQKAFLARVSFAGELGWEVHAANAQMAEIYDAILGAGAKPFGMFSLNSLRIEKGYRAWKGDLSTDYSLLEGDLGRFVKLDKDESFPGKTALLNENQQGSSKRFVSLKVEAGACDAPYMSTLWSGNDVVGETTSGAWGYRVNSSLALGMLRSDLASAGTKVDVEIFGERFSATVQAGNAVWDPENARLRA